MRHMLLQDSLLGDLGWQVIWGLCRAASRGAPGRRTSGAKSKYTQRSRRHSCRLSSSVTVRATYPMLGGVVMLACLRVSAGPKLRGYRPLRRKVMASPAGHAKLLILRRST